MLVRTLRAGALPRLLRVLARGGLDAVLPPLCPGCADQLTGSRWICGECRRRFEPVPRCRICLACRVEARPRGDRRGGFSCRATEHARYGLRAAFWLQPPLDRVVHALKYEGRRDLARPLGTLLAARAASVEGGGVVAVPLHRTRLRERGYNQAALLAGIAARSWGIPTIERALVRGRATVAQARTPEPDRSANVRGAFAVEEKSWVRGRSWVLVDDVATTGSTLLEGVRALEEAGATAIVSAVVALA